MKNLSFLLLCSILFCISTTELLGQSLRKSDIETYKTYYEMLEWNCVKNSSESFLKDREFSFVISNNMMADDIVTVVVVTRSNFENMSQQDDLGSLKGDEYQIKKGKSLNLTASTYDLVRILDSKRVQIFPAQFAENLKSGLALNDFTNILMVTSSLKKHEERLLDYIGKCANVSSEDRNRIARVRISVK